MTIDRETTDVSFFSLIRSHTIISCWPIVLDSIKERERLLNTRISNKETISLPRLGTCGIRANNKRTNERFFPLIISKNEGTINGLFIG